MQCRRYCGRERFCRRTRNCVRIGSPGTMSFAGKRRALVVGLLAAVISTCLLARPTGGQSSREAEGARLLRGAIDMHFHMDALSPVGDPIEQADIAKVKLAYVEGMRGLLFKNHHEPTATLA